ncbi:DoxX family protein [Pedobacter sp.]|uniref:DoxX family protein n=1 Tax=Pedobacter sp. TaxID=1411316 RepID=UPI003D7F5276
MKKYKIYFWISTIFIVLFEGVMPLLSYDTELAREGIRHLGYPAYFGTALVVFKVLGSVLLIIPKLPPRVKEWTYAGFAFDFVFASISHGVVDGIGGQAIFPLVILAILIVSYVNYHRMLAVEKQPFNSFKDDKIQSPVSG